jgi:hypothetical protein
VVQGLNILDNLNAHKKNDEWLAAHPNVTFHFTPTTASWLDQVEIWFGIFQRKTLQNASFSSVDQLVETSHQFTAAYNQNAAPFVWRKREVKGTQLRNTIVNLCNQTLAVFERKKHLETARKGKRGFAMLFP